MPRAARQKEEGAIYHVMSRSLTDVDLFRDDEDKERYLAILSRYKDKYKCKIYGYCLMSNHLHLHFDPYGFDISKFMKCLNLAYAIYYNSKYNRKGPLFRERFNSKIIDNDSYNMMVSGYIHNNPKDIEGYSGKEHEYPFSSMGIYADKREDVLKLVDVDFVLSQINSQNKSVARLKYAEFVAKRRDMSLDSEIKDYLLRFSNEKYKYKNYREIFLRDKDPKEIVKYISDIFGISSSTTIMRKWQRESIKFRSSVAYALAVFCGLSYKEICKMFHNISECCCARLCKLGMQYWQSSDIYKEMEINIIKGAYNKA